MRKIGILFYLLYFLQSCEYEVLHKLVDVNFEVETECYWASFRLDETIQGDLLWDFGDGDTSSLKNPRHIYDLAGQYEVTLTVTNEEGAGEFSKVVVINQPSGNTFRTENEPHGEYKEYFYTNFLGGYDLLVEDFSSKLTSVFRYSDRGILQGMEAEGSKEKDFVAYHTAQGFIMQVTNNIDEGYTDIKMVVALEGSYSFFFGKEDKYLSTKAVVFSEEDQAIFALGIYGSTRDSEEGFILYNIRSSNLLEIPFEKTDLKQVFYDLVLTPKQEILLAYSIDGKGVHVIKISKDLEKVWEKELPDINFDSGEPRFNPIDDQEPISIVAISEEEYVLTVADSDRYLHSDPGIFDAEPKTSIIKGNKDHIDWSMIKERLVSARALNIAHNKDIILCASLAIDRQQHTSTYMLRLKPTGDIIFEKELFSEVFDIFPKEILETPDGNFLIVGRSLDFLQVDCGGNF